jgi:choline dehydrogenase-like flavoprotein
MSTVLVVGSGPSGVHLAQTLLDHGHAVVMLDVGHEKPEPVLPDQDFDGLKDVLDDPVDYFLGAGGEAVVFPTRQAKYYAFPPSKDYVFAAPVEFSVATSEFEPVISFAAGGLAEAWTAGSYPLNDAELTDFPFDFAALEPHYATVMRRIGVTAKRDDLARFSRWFDDYIEPVDTDAHSSFLLERYAKRRTLLNSSGFYLGRSRVAVLTRNHEERQACDKLGRCLWGCPRDALYAPSSTLRQLRRRERFRYVSGVYVTHFTYDGDKISSVIASSRDGGTHEFTADTYALAAGTLCSSKILLDSIFRRTGEVHELPGLMDNRQIMIPFLSTGLLGGPVKTRSYQFHQLALGIERPRPEEYVHGQITTLKAASVHPVVQSLPFDLRSALRIFRMAHAALGAANVWLHDRREPRNLITVRPRHGRETDLVLRYSSGNAGPVADSVNVVKRALGTLGCVVPPTMTKILPSGSSVHYAGTVPMQSAGGRFTCTPECRSRDFRNLYFADGATFPFLPAKNLTFTLMANAVRVADAINRELSSRASRVA